MSIRESRVLAALFLLLLGLASSGCVEQPASPADEDSSQGLVSTPSLWREVREPVRDVGLPRKVLIGTVIHPFWTKPDTDEEILAIVAHLVDETSRRASADYPGRSLDLVVLPEGAVCRSGSHAAETSLPLAGPVADTIGSKAREHSTYILLPMFLEEDRADGEYSNASVLFDRSGDIVGIYRKVHPVASLGSDLLEGGVRPGTDYPVFECDFGRVGVQVCWDLSYEEGWRELARKGAEIVALPSESPQLAKPAYYASRGRYYVVSATPRNNASIFNPAGMVEAQITEPGALVHEIDLASLVLPWSGPLRNGAGLKERFGDRIGFHYYESEDAGIFWSNDPTTSVSEMVKELGLVEFDWRIKRTEVLQKAARAQPGEGTH
ncbi:MAG: carbon-nitrogen hydrolase family protein [Acidobacteriota bacterium]|nr:MAG: carbon-nitrogen hydrolase family protein [Acidobacteriota bacterium]